jgi:LmbE family N-acetylglucosaminyl deacetylase
VLDISKFQNNERILLLAAHPDDEVLGVGGTAKLLSEKGASVLPVFFCENASIRYGNKLEAQLEKYSHKCAKTLGLASPEFLRFPDQKLDTFPMVELAQAVEKLIKNIQPHCIFTHHSGDINKDHQMVFEATMIATRPKPDQIVKHVLSYETISSTEWGHPSTHPVFMPNIFVNIENFIDAKISAFAHYKSEVCEYPHPRSLESLRIRSQDWGSRVGVKYAEPFQLLRSVF